ncbi:MAG: DUF1641 domain-containing protein [Thermoleophilia bacterium]|nr:DUF1641 domain-containing protein [Thermoleophilia bacterium]
MTDVNASPSLDPAGAMARLLERVEHIDRVVSRLERLGDDATTRALETLAARADDLDRLARVLEQAPGLVAMAADLFDEWARAQAERGLDVEKSLRQGLHAALWLGERVSEVELERLGIFLRSEVLEPHALAVVGKTGRALAACHSEACNAATPASAGPVEALRALNDPDVRRSLGFLIRVAKCFGASVAEPGPDATNP